MKKFCSIILVLSIIFAIVRCEKENLENDGDFAYAAQEYSSSLEPELVVTELYRYSFESGLEGWIDGGSDCARTEQFASDGSWSVYIRDDTGLNASLTSPSWDLSGLTSINITFSFYARSMEAGENFYVEKFDGTSWTLVQDYVVGVDFPNEAFSTKTITLTSPTASTQIRFICDASTNSDIIFLDNIILTGDDSIVIPCVGCTQDTIFFDIADLEVSNHSGYPGWAVYRFIPKNLSQYGTAAIFSQFTQIVRSDNLQLELCLVRADQSNYGNRLVEITGTQEGIYTSQRTTPNGFIFPPTDLVPNDDQHIVFIQKEIRRSPADGVPDFYGVITPDFAPTMPAAFVASKNFKTGDRLGFAVR